jgi:hypothetical protein
MFAPWVDPNAAQLDALQAKLDAPQQPTFTPEQIAQRKTDNANQYALGILGQLSGNKDLGDVGGSVFKQALANQQPKYTDHGTYDPITGEFNYSPDYLYDRTQNQFNMVANRSAAQQNNYVMNQQRLAEKLQQERETRASSERNAALIAGGFGLGSGQPMQIGSSPQGWPVFRDKQGRLLTYDTQGGTVPYQGPVSPKETNASPTVDESTAAGWYDMMQKSLGDMKRAEAESPSAALPSTMETLAGTLPGSLGGELQNAMRSGPRQRFEQAINAYAESALHMATGAGFGIEEARSKIRELTPRWGEDADTRAQKQASLETYLNSARRRAGRALTQGTTQAGPQAGMPAVGAAPAAAAAPDAAASDPWGVRARLFPGG